MEIPFRSTEYSISLVNDYLSQGYTLNQKDYKNRRFYNFFEKESITNFYKDLSYWQQRGLMWEADREESILLFENQLANQLIVEASGPEVIRQHRKLFTDRPFIYPGNVFNYDFFLAYLSLTEVRKLSWKYFLPNDSLEMSFNAETILLFAKKIRELKERGFYMYKDEDNEFELIVSGNILALSFLIGGLAGSEYLRNHRDLVSFFYGQIEEFDFEVWKTLRELTDKKLLSVYRSFKPTFKNLAKIKQVLDGDSENSRSYKAFQEAFFGSLLREPLATVKKYLFIFNDHFKKNIFYEFRQPIIEFNKEIYDYLIARNKFAFRFTLPLDGTTKIDADILRRLIDFYATNTLKKERTHDDFFKKYLFLAVYAGIGDLSLLEYYRSFYSEIDFYEKKYRQDLVDAIRGSEKVPVLFNTAKLTLEAFPLLMKEGKLDLARKLCIEHTTRTNDDTFLRQQLPLFTGEPVYLHFYYPTLYYNSKVVHLLIDRGLQLLKEIKFGKIAEYDLRTVSIKGLSQLYVDLPLLREYKLLDDEEQILAILYKEPFVTDELSYITGRPRHVLPQMKILAENERPPSGFYLPVFRIDNLFYNQEDQQKEAEQLEQRESPVDEELKEMLDVCGTFFYFEPESVMYLRFDSYEIYKDKREAYRLLSGDYEPDDEEQIDRHDVHICQLAGEKQKDVVLLLDIFGSVNYNTEILDTRDREVCYQNLYKIENNSYITALRQRANADPRIFRPEYGFLKF